MDLGENEVEVVHIDGNVLLHALVNLLIQQGVISAEMLLEYAKACADSSCEKEEKDACN